MSRPKSFLIGFPETGGDEAASGLEEGGKRLAPSWRPREWDWEQGTLLTALDLVPDHEVFHGGPWPLLAREALALWPDARFVLTVRPPEEWIAAMVQRHGRKEDSLRRLMFGVGCPRGHEERYLRRYQRHTQEMRELFARRKQQLLEIDPSAYGALDLIRAHVGVFAPSQSAARPRDLALL